MGLSGRPSRIDSKGVLSHATTTEAASFYPRQTAVRLDRSNIHSTPPADAACAAVVVVVVAVGFVVGLVDWCDYWCRPIGSPPGSCGSGFHHHSPSELWSQAARVSTWRGNKQRYRVGCWCWPRRHKRDKTRNRAGKGLRCCSRHTVVGLFSVFRHCFRPVHLLSFLPPSNRERGLIPYLPRTQLWCGLGL